MPWFLEIPKKTLPFQTPNRPVRIKQLSGKERRRLIRVENIRRSKLDNFTVKTSLSTGLITRASIV